MEHTDILIIGAGAAGIAAAKAAASSGRRILLVDRKTKMGGVLLQCAHRGFGNELTGPEYAEKLLADFPDSVTFLPNTTVLSVTNKKAARLSGGREVSFDSLILASGCREIPIGALPIAGTRPTGVYTAGQMQELMNLYGFVPEGPVAILGTGDLGLVLASHLLDAGISISAMVEKKEHIGGMARNQRFLKQTHIPLYLNNTITTVHGHPHLEGVSLRDGSYVPCRTLLIAAGLRPEQELVHHLGNPEWLYLCGNCNRIQPMVEAVVSEGKQAGIAAGNQGGRI